VLLRLLLLRPLLRLRLKLRVLLVLLMLLLILLLARRWLRRRGRVGGEIKRRNIRFGAAAFDGDSALIVARIRSRWVQFPAGARLLLLGSRCLCQ
jgi:hypothetical protein